MSPIPKELVRTGVDGVRRCWWCGDAEDYIAYHDEEWGRPVTDDDGLFEKLCLEGFQSGLSWLTILRKREGFRRAFKGFDIDAVARMRSSSVERLLQDASIVRHRGKIESVLNNAKRARELRDAEGSLVEYFWRHREDRPFPGVIASTDASKAISKDLKKRGWSYVGPTTVYAFMQAMGLVNDHAPGCSHYDEVERERAAV